MGFEGELRPDTVPRSDVVRGNSKVGGGNRVESGGNAEMTFLLLAGGEEDGHIFCPPVTTPLYRKF